MTKMNPEYVMRALEICAEYANKPCPSHCPYGGFKCLDLTKDALDLLREKDAEIERLNVNMNAYGLTAKNLAQEFEDYRADVQMEIADARAEAITEFAERIKKFYSNLNGKTASGSVEYHIEQVAKEMRGEAQ